MSGEWRTVKLGDVLTLQRGFDLPERLRRPGTVPIVSSAGPSGTHADGKVMGPGVVTGRYGTIGQVFWVEGEYWPLNTTLWVADFKGNDPRYCYYLLRTIDFETCSDKAAVPGVNRNDLHEIEVVVAPRELQPRLAEILAALDDKIDLNRRMNRTLEATSSALFKSWFVDFDPVVAKSEGRRPFGMTDDVAKLFPSRFVDSELGPIPEGWRVDTIGNCVDVVGGSTPSTDDANLWLPPDHFWATPKDLSKQSDNVLLGTERRISDAGLSRIGSGLLPEGTVLLSSRAPIGYLAVCEVPAAVNQGFIALKPSTLLPPRFLLHWLQTTMEEIEGRSNGTTFMEISKANFRPIRMVVPDARVVSEYARQSIMFHERVVGVSRASRTLAALRDSLLPRLLSGELELKATERAVARAV